MKIDEIKFLNKIGIARSYDSMPTMTANNINIPNNLLIRMSTETVEVLTAKRSGQEALGINKKVISWEEEKYQLPIIERTGKTVAYSDYGTAPRVGINLNYGEVGQYRFSTGVEYGKLETSKINKTGINYVDELMASAYLALGIEMNRALYYGYIENSGGNNAYLVYGLLNYPFLENYKVAPKTFENMNYIELVQFFTTAIANIVTKTGSNVDVNSKMRIVLASPCYVELVGKMNEKGEISALETIQKKYPNVSFISSNEMIKANAGQNVMYIFVEENIGGTQPTSFASYTEIGFMSDTVNLEDSVRLKVHSGTCGAVIPKPILVTRYTNI